LSKIENKCDRSEKTLEWQAKVVHHKNLLIKIADQTERRVTNK
jgi:hypothetical protein